MQKFNWRIKSSTARTMKYPTIHINQHGNPATSIQATTITALGGKYLCRRQQWELMTLNPTEKEKKRKKSELISHHELKIHYRRRRRRRHDLAIFGAEWNYQAIKAIWHNLHKGRGNGIQLLTRIFSRSDKNTYRSSFFYASLPSFNLSRKPICISFNCVSAKTSMESNMRRRSCIIQEG